MKYLYIHGGNATSRSFNYIRQHIGGVDAVLDYDSSKGFNRNLTEMIEKLKSETELFMIAHSLGGIYALYIADQLPKRICGAVTLATPYGGSNIAGLASMMMPQSQLLRDIIPRSDTMKGAAAIKIQHPWFQVVTTKGTVPWLEMPNDGIVTRESMLARKDLEMVELDANHYEVVLDPRTVELIKSRIS